MFGQPASLEDNRIASMSICNIHVQVNNIHHQNIYTQKLSSVLQTNVNVYKRVVVIVYWIVFIIKLIYM